ncbi:MAG: hypothetical protein HRT68_10230 [Flavobacteriaceae bacterium]|nr:hypothetical protein [Flavobacteriaceae bacterium]
MGVLGKNTQGTSGTSIVDAIIQPEVEFEHQPTAGTSSPTPICKSILINSLNGKNTIQFPDGSSFEIGTGSRLKTINLSGVKLNYQDGVIPELIISGTGNFQWIVIDKITQ